MAGLPRIATTCAVLALYPLNRVAPRLRVAVEHGCLSVRPPSTGAPRVTIVGYDAAAASVTGNDDRAPSPAMWSWAGAAL